MGKVKPGYWQKMVLHLEPKRAAATIGYTVLAVILLAVAAVALLYRTDTWPAEWRPTGLSVDDVSESTVQIVAAVAAGLALLLVIGAIANGRRWHTARTVERLSEDPELVSLFPDTRMAASGPRAATIPPLEVRVVTPRAFPRSKAKLRRVTAERNIIGYPPLRILYLRLFENQPRMRTFIEGAWREFGYVSFLRSAASVTPAELRDAKRSGNVAKMFVASPDQLAAALGGPATPLPKGRYKFTRISATTIRVKDRYGNYPIRPVLCHGGYWKAAVDVLLARVDVVALDLSGFTTDNAGTRYELQRVIDRFPIERIVFLADQRSKAKFLDQEMHLAWSQMAPGSPNADHRPRTALVVRTDYFHSTESTNQQGQTTQSQVRLIAHRRQTRRVAAAVQERLVAAAPAPAPFAPPVVTSHP